jgi:hypothetical protein
VASLETPPSITGFEWDERIEDQGDDDFVDGMAILPSRVNGGGYLGMDHIHVFLPSASF